MSSLSLFVEKFSYDYRKAGIKICEASEQRQTEHWLHIMLFLSSYVMYRLCVLHKSNIVHSLSDFEIINSLLHAKYYWFFLLTKEMWTTNVNFFLIVAAKIFLVWNVLEYIKNFICSVIVFELSKRFSQMKHYLSPTLDKVCNFCNK